MSKAELWNRFQTHYHDFRTAGLAIDVSRMRHDTTFLKSMQPLVDKALAEMAAIERGELINSDEKRMVGHYWLRNADLAPTAAIRSDIVTVIENVEKFSASVHNGSLKGANGSFMNALIIGIGGSALGPQLVAHALGHPSRDKLNMFFFDNTDPDGMDRVLAALKGQLGHTLCVVISKSGSTKETRNGMLEVQAAYDQTGLRFSDHVVAITGPGSQLHQHAEKEGWLRCFPMWDWVGGRTSETSVVGLLPAALQGLDIRRFLAGAKACDDLTRLPNIDANPALTLALCWHYIGKGKGQKDMVILPYKDRLELFSKYLQQLVMESLGKELDREGKVVHQGLTVYGNKGSTDQHAYIQQLRDGLANFFVTFIEVLHDREGTSLMVEEETTSGDYLFGFFMGTRQALYESGRESMTLSLDEISPFHMGSLIALFERAVGLYAAMIHINAYHQPGVEAGKKAAGQILSLQLKVLNHLKATPGQAQAPDTIATAIGSPQEAEAIFKIATHLAANPERGVLMDRGTDPQSTTFSFKG